MATLYYQLKTGGGRGEGGRAGGEEGKVDGGRAGERDGGRGRGITTVNPAASEHIGKREGRVI